MKNKRTQAQRRGVPVRWDAMQNTPEAAEARERMIAKRTKAEPFDIEKGLQKFSGANKPLTPADAAKAFTEPCRSAKEARERMIARQTGGGAESGVDFQKAERQSKNARKEIAKAFAELDSGAEQARERMLKRRGLK